jgi:hypothetical protein
MSMTKLLRTIGTVVLLVCLANPATADVVLYSQSPLVYPPGGFPPGHDLVWSSMPLPPFGNSLAFDSFRLSSPSQINTVTWEGGYFGPGTQVPISNFSLAFYTDAGGTPGAQIGPTEIIPFANANESNLRTQTGSDGRPVLVADYSANLPNSFLAASDTPYWLSIAANIPGYSVGQPTQFGIHIGQGGDGTSFQEFLGGNFVRPNDLAFSHIGVNNVIPEPTSLAAWAVMGLSGLVYCRHRRKVKAV